MKRGEHVYIQGVKEGIMEKKPPYKQRFCDTTFTFKP